MNLKTNKKTIMLKSPFDRVCCQWISPTNFIRRFMLVRQCSIALGNWKLENGIFGNKSSNKAMFKWQQWDSKASLVKWLSVGLWTKYFWVWILLLLLKLQISRLFRARRSLNTTTQGKFNAKRIRDMIIAYYQVIFVYILRWEIEYLLQSLWELVASCLAPL